MCLLFGSGHELPEVCSFCCCVGVRITHGLNCCSSVKHTMPWNTAGSNVLFNWTELFLSKMFLHTLGIGLVLLAFKCTIIHFTGYQIAEKRQQPHIRHCIFHIDFVYPNLLVSSQLPRIIKLVSLTPLKSEYSHLPEDVTQRLSLLEPQWYSLQPKQPGWGSKISCILPELSRQLCYQRFTLLNFLLCGISGVSLQILTVITSAALTDYSHKATLFCPFV